MQRISRFAGALPAALKRYKRELCLVAAGVALVLPLGYAAQLRAEAASEARQGVILSGRGTLSVGRVEVFAEVPGVVRDLPVPGTRVINGQPVVRLENMDLEAAVVVARSEWDVARAALARTQAPQQPGELEDLQAAVELATIALDAAQRASDTFHAGMNSAARPRQDALAALAEELRALKAKAGQTDVPHHPAAEPAPGQGDIHVQTQPQEQGEDADCEVHRLLRELTRLFETVTVTVAAADQAAAVARDNTLMEQLMAQVEVARVNLKHAVARRDRASVVPPPPDAAVAHAQIQQAQTKLALAERRLQKASVLSPLSGSVLEVPVTMGTPVAVGQPLLVLSNESDVSVTLRVSARSANGIEPGQKATVSVDGTPLYGRVAAVDRAPNSNWAVLRVTLERIGRSVEDGALVTVKVFTSSTAER